VKIIPLVEAAYRLEDRPEPWLDRIVDAVAHLDRGLGLCAYTWRDAPDGLQMTSELVLRNAPDGVGELAASFISAATAVEREISYRRTGAIDTMSRVFGSIPPERIEAGYWTYFEQASRIGIGDVLGIKTVDPTGIGATVAVLLPRPTPEAVSSREEALWRSAMVHVSAGLRLGRAFGVDDADAVLEADGRCAHARDTASATSVRGALRDAARRIDRARTELRDDPRAALDAWRGLVQGRWSLIDHFDNDGRRYVLAVRNDPQIVDPRALSLRERQTAAYAAMGWTNKEIAYALGLPTSTVSTYLGRAKRKLGAETHADLARIASELRAGLPDERSLDR
jgi:DNA-binding CsgD family transcriptional regulator